MNQDFFEKVRKSAAEALGVQNACNARGVAHSLLQAQNRIADLLVSCDAYSSGAMNKSQIVAMFTFKLMDLARLSYDCLEYSRAYQACKAWETATASDAGCVMLGDKRTPLAEAI